MQKYVCMRFYANMSGNYTIRDKEGMESWLENNKKNRPGNALYIDGEYVENTGYTVDHDKIKAWYETVKEKYQAMDFFKMAERTEYFGGRIIATYFGYSQDFEIKFNGSKILT